MSEIFPGVQLGAPGVPLQGASEAIQQGMGLAQASQQIQNQKAQLQAQQQATQLQAATKGLELAQQATKTSGPMQQFTFDQMDKLAPILGMKVSDGFKAAAKSNVEGLGDAISHAQNEINTTGRISPDTFAALQKVVGTDETMAGIKEMSQIASQRKSAEALGQYRAGQLDLGQQKVDAMAGMNAIRTDQRAQTIDQRDQSIHQRYVNQVSNDPILKQRLTQYQNLDNALSMITQAKDLTPEQIQEFQQSVRSNLGIKGTSGVDERSNTILNPLGLKAARWQEFLTGDPAKLSKDSNLMNHLKDLANVEQKNISNQIQGRIAAKAAGGGTFYKKHPDLKDDLMNTITATQGQFGGQPQVAPAATGQAPQAAPAAPQMVHVIDSQGKHWDLPADKLDAAMKMDPKLQKVGQ